MFKFLVCCNSLENVDAKKPKPVEREPVTDEVTTVPGYEVTVYPSKFYQSIVDKRYNYEKARVTLIYLF